MNEIGLNDVQALHVNEKLLESDLEKIRRLFADDAKVTAALEAGKTEVQLAAEKLRSEAKTLAEKKLELTPKKRKKRVHYKIRRAKGRAIYRKYTAPRNKRIRAELLEGPSWLLMVEYWDRKKMRYTITREEWEEAVAPCVVDRLFYINRYDTKKPLSLDNIIVRARSDDEVLFDGAEYRLRQLGYMI